MNIKSNDIDFINENLDEDDFNVLLHNLEILNSELLKITELINLI